jgi:hypothetical protein
MNEYDDIPITGKKSDNEYGDIPITEKKSKSVFENVEPVSPLVKMIPGLSEGIKRGQAAAYGALTSLLGGLGDVESITAPKAKTPELRGHETTFPTTKEIRQQTLGELPKYKTSVQAGEILPMLVGGYQLGKSGAEYLGGLLRGTRAKEAAKELQTGAEALRGRAAQAVGAAEEAETAATRARRTRQEKGAEAAEQRFVSQAQQEREAAAAKFGDLGTPKGKAELGDEMQRRLVGTEKRLGSARQQRASEDFGRLFKEGNAKDWSASEEKARLLDYFTKESTSPLAGPDSRGLAAQIAKELQQTESYQGAEEVFRKFKELSVGPPAEGFTGFKQQKAGSYSDYISKVLDEFLPNRNVVRTRYAEYSTPLDAFETSFGGKAVATEKAVPEALRTMPTNVPDIYFKNRDTINQLRTQLQGDEAAVRKFANQYTVNELQGKNAAQAQQWLQTNKPWVGTVEGLNTRVERYVEELARREAGAAEAERRAALIAKKRGEITSGRQTEERRIRESAEKLRDQLDTAAIALKRATPETIAGEAEKLLLSIEKSKNLRNLVSESAITALREQIAAVDKAYQGVEKSQKIKDLFVKYGLIYPAAGYGGYEAYKTIGR